MAKVREIGSYIGDKRFILPGERTELAVINTSETAVIEIELDTLKGLITVAPGMGFDDVFEPFGEITIRSVGEYNLLTRS